MVRRTLRDALYSPDHDVLVFAYTSDTRDPAWKKSSQRAYTFDSVALKLRDQKVKSVVAIAYDVFIHGYTSDIDGNGLP